MSQNRDKKRRGIYDNIDNPEDVEVITLELDKVPLQDLVSAMRKSAVHAVNDAKVLYDKTVSEFTRFVSTARAKANDQLGSVGITNPALAIQVAAIGSAGLFGLLLARKRSTFRRVLYPTLMGGSVWAAFHLSSASNRIEAWNKLKEIEKGYHTSITKYRKKNSERFVDPKK